MSFLALDAFEIIIEGLEMCRKFMDFMGLGAGAPATRFAISEALQRSFCHFY